MKNAIVLGMRGNIIYHLINPWEFSFEITEKEMRILPYILRFTREAHSACKGCVLLVCSAFLWYGLEIVLGVVFSTDFTSTPLC